ncbi:MAG: phosphoribosylformylglycinamidine synthase I [bacterium]
MGKVRVLILRTAGTNCDYETRFAFDQVGARTTLEHINQLIRGNVRLKEFEILAIPGGFTYGDDIAAGKILANELKYKLEEDIDEFVKDGKLAIGICNGFQVLVKAGLLPALDGTRNQVVTLASNDSNRFEDRWVYLKTNRKSKSVYTKGLSPLIYLPVAHAEGKFVPKGRGTLRKLKENRQIVFTYVDEEGEPTGYPGNPNGSVEGIAGICDPTGRIFGLMPHPERHIHPTQHPRWTREGLEKEGDGLAIFRNGVRFAAKNLI